MGLPVSKCGKFGFAAEIYFGIEGSKSNRNEKNNLK
jgi:hypothetical protein